MPNRGLIFHRHKNESCTFIRSASIGVTWLRTLAGRNRPWVLETSIYEGVKLEKGGNWFQLVLNIIQAFPSVSPIFFSCLSSTQ